MCADNPGKLAVLLTGSSRQYREWLGLDCSERARLYTRLRRFFAVTCRHNKDQR
jgi:hypothetical protein